MAFRHPLNQISAFSASYSRINFCFIPGKQVVVWNCHATHGKWKTTIFISIDYALRWWSWFVLVEEFTSELLVVCCCWRGSRGGSDETIAAHDLLPRVSLHFSWLQNSVYNTSRDDLIVTLGFQSLCMTRHTNPAAVLAATTLLQSLCANI